MNPPQPAFLGAPGFPWYVGPMIALFLVLGAVLVFFLLRHVARRRAAP